jgi:hypothetical protein
MVVQSYAARRSEFAEQIGLGRKAAAEQPRRGAARRTANQGLGRMNAPAACLITVVQYTWRQNDHHHALSGRQGAHAPSHVDDRDRFG